MTNTLHRFGDVEDFGDDYIVFAMCTRGKNDEGAAPHLRKFLEICAKHVPVNLGDGKNGGLSRPSRNLNPLAHWSRPESGTPEQVIEGVAAPTTVAAVFDSADKLRDCLQEVRVADLGLSINVAAVTADAMACAKSAGIDPHAVEYSLGFIGNTGALPESDTLALMTMCGHGMVSAAYTQKMVEFTKTGRKSAHDCAVSMSRFCVCGIFNPVRAERLLCRLANRQDA